jgi:hypothetical protein
VHYFQNSGKAGAPILGRLVALHLLRLDPKAARQALLRHSRRYACSDQGFGQILDAFENHSFAPAGVEPLGGFNLLSQFLDLTPSRLTLGLPQSSADVRRARLTGQLGECVLKPLKPLLLRRVSLHNWRAESGFLASSICSRLRSTVKARISIWFGSTTSLIAPQAPVSTSLPETVLVDPHYLRSHRITTS